MIDPYLSDSVNRVAGRPRMLPVTINPEHVKCDAVICTHNHLDPDTVKDIKDGQLFITTNEGKAELKKLGKTNVEALSTDESITVGDFEITAVFADHMICLLQILRIHTHLLIKSRMDLSWNSIKNMMLKHFKSINKNHI